jgi:hypothetical protein
MGRLSRAENPLCPSQLEFYLIHEGVFDRNSLLDDHKASDIKSAARFDA